MNNRKMTGIQLIAPTKQGEWALPATANFVLGGAGTGFYLVSVLNIILWRGMSAMVHPVLFGMWAPVLMGLGFVFLAAEAGRPSRGRHLLGHLRSAWISRETLAFAFFAPAVILDNFFPHLVFKVCAGVSALFFMAAQGFILYSSRAIPAWNVSIMPLFFLSSGFVSGAGLVLLLAASGRLLLGDGFMLFSLICVIINLVIWICYLRRSNDVDFQLGTRALRHPSKMFVTIVFGHVVSILILFLFQIQTYIGLESSFPHALITISGIAIIIGVAAQKIGIILSAGYAGEVVLKF